jgi:hypothetical protein
MELLIEGFKRALLLILHLDAGLTGIIVLSLDSVPVPTHCLGRRGQYENHGRHHPRDEKSRKQGGRLADTVVISVKKGHFS